MRYLPRRGANLYEDIPQASKHTRLFLVALLDTLISFDLYTIITFTNLKRKKLWETLRKAW
jgi:hypothetical protein